MKRYLLWILEALAWFAVITAIVMVTFVSNQYSLKKNYSYHIFFRDVDGLKNGSPVRISGVQVGYVDNVEIINNDEMSVNFIITDKKIDIPKGTLVKVESAGIVGSKSLELYPPEVKQNDTVEQFVPLCPNRIHGAFSAQSEMAEIILVASNSLNKAVDISKIPSIRTFFRNQKIMVQSLEDIVVAATKKQAQIIKDIPQKNPMRHFNDEMEKFKNE